MPEREIEHIQRLYKHRIRHAEDKFENNDVNDNQVHRQFVFHEKYCFS
jgi:hypothetical protein